MLRCQLSHHYQNWDAYVSAPTNVYNSKVHRSTNTRLLYVVLNWRIPGHELQFTVYNGKVLPAAKQWARFLATLQK